MKTKPEHSSVPSTRFQPGKLYRVKYNTVFSLGQPDPGDSQLFHEVAVPKNSIVFYIKTDDWGAIHVIYRDQVGWIGNVDWKYGEWRAYEEVTEGNLDD